MRFRHALRCCTAVLIVLTVATPWMELMDRWDIAAGPGRDTEIHVFCWVLVLCLILTAALICSRVSLLRIRGALRMLQFVVPVRRSFCRHELRDRLVPPDTSPPVPLRI